MHATTNATRLFACRARSLPCLLLLLALHPTSLESFVVNYHGGLPRVRANDATIARGGTQPSASPSAVTTSRSCTFGIRARASRCSIMSMGGGAMDGGGNEHKDKEDQREGTEDSSSGTDDDLLVGVQGRDWRLFRKNLISKYGRDDSRATWGEGCWAHEIGEVEPGCLLLATEEIWDGPFHQSVILVLSHDHDLGTVGLILNRPGPQRVHSLAGLKWDLAEFFADSQVFDGGPVGLGTMMVLHAAEGAEGSQPILPGVNAGGFYALLNMARKGTVAKDRVRFVRGHSAWSPGQLQGELDRNQWFVAAAAPELITADCDRPSNPLWATVLRLMGSRYRDVADRSEPST